MLAQSFLLIYDSSDRADNHLQTAVLFARCMAEKIPQKKECEIPSEVRRWSEFIGGKPL